MREDGYSSRTRQALDLMALEFGEAFERARDATVMVDAPQQPRKARPQVAKPLYTQEQLLRFLGVETEELDPLTQAAVTTDMFEGLGLEE
jgi:hypothetical protein